MNIDENKTISIITANYNSSAYIDETLHSVQNQTYQDWEMIIIDDCSTDNSVEIVTNYITKDKRIKLFQLMENSGPAITRNKGIQEAKGRYITFLDSDDLWEKEFLEKSLFFMNSNNYSFICSSYYRKNVDMSEDFGNIIVPEKVTYYDLLKSNTVSCLTAMYDTQKLGKCYMPAIHKRQDLGLWLHILEKTKYCYGIREPLATYRMRKSSVSSNKISAAKYTWKLYYMLERLNIFQKIYYFSIYMINGVRKYKNVKR